MFLKRLIILIQNNPIQEWCAMGVCALAFPKYQEKSAPKKSLWEGFGPPREMDEPHQNVRLDEWLSKKLKNVPTKIEKHKTHSNLGLVVLAIAKHIPNRAPLQHGLSAS